MLKLLPYFFALTLSSYGMKKVEKDHIKKTIKKVTEESHLPLRVIDLVDCNEEDDRDQKLSVAQIKKLSEQLKIEAHDAPKSGEDVISFMARTLKNDPIYSKKEIATELPKDPDAMVVDGKYALSFHKIIEIERDGSMQIHSQMSMGKNYNYGSIYNTTKYQFNVVNSAMIPISPNKVQGVKQENLYPFISQQFLEMKKRQDSGESKFLMISYNKDKVENYHRELKELKNQFKELNSIKKLEAFNTANFINSIKEVCSETFDYIDGLNEIKDNLKIVRNKRTAACIRDILKEFSTYSQNQRYVEIRSTKSTITAQLQEFIRELENVQTSGTNDTAK